MREPNVRHLTIIKVNQDAEKDFEKIYRDTEPECVVFE